ncbi:AraC family transcriptional regulator [Mycobacterium branderi]|uniref:AraC family transcriptional regulator n=1 Tax=Mycobacterium branderi TaxID=43348 RepID=A0A7I7WAG0_9MYCO|nr:AraC family transcriptional regulator [Mycobacterium branderi]MCV7232105.1 AraC family transcriptional regulator ligand-binding domain-containing protein [Mycobacterium branderi]ORA31520.1 AraC family transcriptional regulator [Mycobacterium branderi]BBZ14120.1 putative HTH-type transcriptional regulator [Mycobacterium branderi]
MTTWSPDLRHRMFASRLLCEVAEERGIAMADLLAGTGIAPADLDDPDAVVTAWDEIVLARRLLERLPEDAGVGVDVGRRFTLTHLGLFGFAVMSCGTLRELFTVAMRYFALTMLQIDVALFEGADDCMLELNADHLPADVRRFFIERDFAGIITTTTGFALPAVAKYADQASAEVAVDEDVLRPLLELIPFENAAFGRAHNRLHFPRAMLDEPLPQADPHTLEICIAQCDVLMQRSEQRRGITAVVRTKLFRDSGAFPTLPDVAAELDMHPRTLRRRLAEEGTSFRALLNEARSALAVDLLRNVGLTVDEVSKRLGYTDPSTFSHAFKRWHGTAPSAYVDQ